LQESHFAVVKYVAAIFLFSYEGLRKEKRTARNRLENGGCGSHNRATLPKRSIIVFSSLLTTNKDKQIKIAQ